MQKLFLDLDDTVKDTEKYIRRILKEEFHDIPDVKSVYFLNPSVVEDKYKKSAEAYWEVMREIFENYEVVPETPGATDCINILASEYDVIFCSSCCTDGEEKAKKKFADLYKRDIIICREDYTKSGVDMSGAIQVDDSIVSLSSTNAEQKIQILNPYLAKGLTYSQYLVGDHLAVNLPDVVDYLNGGKTDVKSTEFRRTIYKGIQNKYKGNRK